MQEIQQEKSVKCNNDCFNCPYPDCIISDTDIKIESEEDNEEDSEKDRKREYQKHYRETHKEQARKAQHDWYVRNTEKRKAQAKARRVKALHERLSTCSQCKCQTGKTVMIYHKKVYCSDECLKTYLLLKAKQKEVRVIEKEG